MKGTATININGVIGGDYYYDGIRASNIIAQLNAANADDKVKDIDVIIDSPGGDVQQGIQIFNAFQKSTKPVNTINNSTAYSIAFVIAQGATGKRKMYANALGMSHNASNFAYGHAKDMRNQATMLDQYDHVIAQCFAAKTGLTLDEVKAKYMDYEDVFLTADECKAQNLVDEVISVSGKLAIENIDRRDVKAVFEYYQNQAIENKMQSAFNNNEESFMQKILNKITGTKPQNIQPDIMKLTNVFNLLCAMDQTKPEVVAALAEANTYAADEKFSQAEVQAKITDAVAPLNLKVKALEDTVTEKTKALNDALIAAGNTIETDENGDAAKPNDKAEKSWQEKLAAMPHNKELGLTFKK